MSAPIVSWSKPKIAGFFFRVGYFTLGAALLVVAGLRDPSLAAAFHVTVCVGLLANVMLRPLQ